MLARASRRSLRQETAAANVVDVDCGIRVLPQSNAFRGTLRVKMPLSVAFAATRTDTAPKKSSEPGSWQN